MSQELKFKTLSGVEFELEPLRGRNSLKAVKLSKIINPTGDNNGFNQFIDTLTDEIEAKLFADFEEVLTLSIIGDFNKICILGELDLDFPTMLDIISKLVNYGLPETQEKKTEIVTSTQD